MCMGSLQAWGAPALSPCNEQWPHNALYYTLLYYTALYYTVLYYTVLYYTTLLYTALYYNILHCILLYYTELHYNSSLLYLGGNTTATLLYPGAN